MALGVIVSIAGTGGNGATRVCCSAPFTLLSPGSLWGALRVVQASLLPVIRVWPEGGFGYRRPAGDFRAGAGFGGQDGRVVAPGEEAGAGQFLVVIEKPVEGARPGVAGFQAVVSMIVLSTDDGVEGLSSGRFAGQDDVDLEVGFHLISAP